MAELAHGAAVYGRNVDAMFSLIIHNLIIEDQRNELLAEQIQKAGEALMRGITAASNLHLVCRDVVLDHLLLTPSTLS